MLFSLYIKTLSMSSKHIPMVFNKIASDLYFSKILSPNTIVLTSHLIKTQYPYRTTRYTLLAFINTEVSNSKIYIESIQKSYLYNHKLYGTIITITIKDDR